MLTDQEIDHPNVIVLSLHVEVIALFFVLNEDEPIEEGQHLLCDCLVLGELLDGFGIESLVKFYGHVLESFYEIWDRFGETEELFGRL